MKNLHGKQPIMAEEAIRDGTTHNNQQQNQVR